ncbi:MAG TPA: hypothetical protein HA348_05200 [Thermoplasmata archaeon]|nr:hypothetical protein [Thermoplasmata archaeon]
MSKEFEGKRIVSRLFGFCRNADFVIGMRKPWDEDNPWASYDVRAVEDTITSLSKAFAGRPEIPEKDKLPEFDPLRNIVSVGGPIPNTFTRKVMGVQKPDERSWLPYSFNLIPTPECKGKTFFELQKDEQNWSIMKSDTKEEVYIPEYYEKDEIGVCRRDYGMIIKVKSQVKEAPPGRKNLVLAGCHGFGTIAAARALGDEKILNRIWEDVKDRDFQAIVMCDVNEDEPEYVELLEVVQL